MVPLPHIGPPLRKTVFPVHRMAKITRPVGRAGFFFFFFFFFFFNSHFYTGVQIRSIICSPFVFLLYSSAHIAGKLMNIFYNILSFHIF